MTAQSCSWCHAMNVIPAGGGPVYCRGCGHRADVCRLDCDCPACRSPRRGYEYHDRGPTPQTADRSDDD
jgi:hypothetical protein